MLKVGVTINGPMDSFATPVSLVLQYNVPLKTLVEKFQHVRFEPSGWTNNADIRYAKSITDYIFCWLGAKYISSEYATSEAAETPNLKPTEDDPQQELAFQSVPVDGPLCAECRSIMTVNGSCYRCPNCGSTSGCS